MSQQGLAEKTEFYARRGFDPCAAATWSLGYGQKTERQFKTALLLSHQMHARGTGSLSGATTGYAALAGAIVTPAHAEPLAAGAAGTNAAADAALADARLTSTVPQPAAAHARR